MHLLGGIDQEEEEGERPRDDGHPFEGQRIDSGEQFLQALARLGAMPSRARRLPQRLDGVKRFFALEPTNYVAECGGKSSDVVMKRRVLGTNREVGGGRGDAQDRAMIAAKKPAVVRMLTVQRPIIHRSMRDSNDASRVTVASFCCERRASI